MRSFILACAVATAAAFVIGDTGDIDLTSLGKFRIQDLNSVKVLQWEDENSKSDPFLLMSSGDSNYGGRITIVPGLKEAVVAGDVTTLDVFELDTGGD